MGFYMIVTERGAGERLAIKTNTERNLGKTAINCWISREKLGIRDTLSHLYRYMESGGDARAIAGIEEDLVTDVIERMENGNFHSVVNFDFDGQDFVSDLEGISMKQMVQTNMEIKKRKTRNQAELLRAEQECAEIESLLSWFKEAELGSYMIFESMPIGEQTMAVAMIYQKLSDKTLSGNFISLYNPSIDNFNLLRKTLGQKSEFDKASDFLGNYYTLDSSYSVSEYITYYDLILDNQSDEKHRFGLSSKDFVDTREKIEKNSVLLKPYMELIHILGNCGGRVNHELIDFCSKTKLRLGGQLVNLSMYDCISTNDARKMIENLQNSIVHEIDDLIKSKKDISVSSDVYNTLGDSGSVVAELGISYSNSACPENTGEDISENVASQSEISILYNIFNNESLKNFGESHYGHCRIKNCPNHGKIGIVGGCDICPYCHAMFQKGMKLKEIEEYYGKINDEELDKKKATEKQKLNKKRQQERLRRMALKNKQAKENQTRTKASSKI